jgi:hypothetical protein
MFPPEIIYFVTLGVRHRGCDGSAARFAGANIRVSRKTMKDHLPEEQATAKCRDLSTAAASAPPPVEMTCV